MVGDIPRNIDGANDEVAQYLGDTSPARGGTYGSGSVSFSFFLHKLSMTTATMQHNNKTPITINTHLPSMF